MTHGAAGGGHNEPPFDHQLRAQNASSSLILSSTAMSRLCQQRANSAMIRQESTTTKTCPVQCLCRAYPACRHARIRKPPFQGSVPPIEVLVQMVFVEFLQILRHHERDALLLIAPLTTVSPDPLPVRSPVTAPTYRHLSALRPRQAGESIQAQQ